MLEVYNNKVKTVEIDEQKDIIKKISETPFSQRTQVEEETSSIGRSTFKS